MTNDWHPADIKPAKPGWYENEYGAFEGIHRRYFDGEKWRATPDSDPRDCTFGWADDRWREIEGEAK